MRAADLRPRIAGWAAATMACLVLALLLASSARADDFIDPFLGADADMELQAPTPAAPAPTDEDSEAEPELASAELLPPALLAGPDYRVEPRAQLYGFQAHFLLHTDYGVITAESVEILTLRVQEMEALKALHAESVTAALAKSGAAAVMAPLRAVANVVQRPGEAITGLPRGVWRYFSERAIRIGQRAKRLGARADQRISHEGSPFDAADAPMAASRRAREKDEDSWFGDVGDEVVRLAKSEAGYGRARRELAARLGVDPYTGNPLIRERLDTLAWAATAGKLGVGQAMGLLDPITSQVLGTSSEVNRLVLELPPEDLRRRNDERLMALGADQDLRYTFLQFGRYSPTLQTALVLWLERLQPKSGVDVLLEIALMAQNEVEARFMVNALAMLHAHLGDRAIGGHIVGVGALLAYDSADGERVFPLPVDLLSWTPDTARWFAQPGLWDHANRSLLVGGAASMRAQRALSRDGWNLFLHLPYEGAPEYARDWGRLPPAG